MTSKMLKKKLKKQKDAACNPDGCKSKYKQYKISEFFQSKPSKLVCAINNNMKKSASSIPSKIVKTVHSESVTKGVLLNERNDVVIPIPLPYYQPPNDEAVIPLSDDSDLDQDFEQTEALGNNKTFSFFRLRDLSSLLPKRVIGVFPPTKLALISTKLKPEILLEKDVFNPDFSTSCVSDRRETSVSEEESMSSKVTTTSTEITVKSFVSQTSLNNINISEDNETGENWNYISNFKKIYEFVSSHPKLSSLLIHQEILMIDTLLYKVDERYAYLCIRLLMRIQNWINIFKLKKEIKLRMSDLEVKDMYNFLWQNQYIVCDPSVDAPVDLLNLLNVSDIREIARSFKMKSVHGKKTDLINRILDYINHQSVLVSSSNTKAILMGRILDKMGICIKLSSNFYILLKKIHFLYSFPNPDYKSTSDLYFHMTRIRLGEIELPNFNIDKDSVVFTSPEEFKSYVEAKKYEIEMQEAFEKKNKPLMLQLCELLYAKLFELNIKHQYRVPDDLFRFTSIYVYTKTLTFGIKHLTKHYPQNVELFLKLLLEGNASFTNMRGTWHDLLVMVQYNYLKKHSEAAETLIQALKEENLSEVDRCALNHRAEGIKTNKSNKLPKIVTDKICFAQSAKSMPSIKITAVRGEHFDVVKGKNQYKEIINGETYVWTVEEIALNHYLKIGYSNGFHCEGRLIWTLFSTLLWNIIYDDSLPGVFISELQELPLDFYADGFYNNRKIAIEKLFMNITNVWSDEQLAQHIKKNWEEHSHKQSLINKSLKLDDALIFEIILCLTKTNLIQIFRRLLSNMKGFRSGLPDLFLWDVESKTCKFVEVKSDRDKLSCTQEVWISFLISIGVDAEVCHVHSLGSKVSRKRKLNNPGV